MTQRLRIVLVIAAVAIAGCAGRQSAPAIERAPGGQTTPPARPPVARVVEPRPQTYTVQRGDTLYGIALDHGLDYKELADWNGVTNPNMIRVGEVLRLQAPSVAATQARPSEDVAQVRPVTGVGAVESRPLGAEAPATARKPDESTIARVEPRQPKPIAEPKVEQHAPPQAAESDDEEKVDWGWPASGKIVARFADPGNKGVDIAGKLGDPVIASAAGKVVYSGAGLRGYGKLIIIKHNKTYLSAYAHNNQILVKEGQSVAKGQRIGEVGASDTDSPKLHFEVRRLGKPVDPMKFLPERPS